MVLNKRWQRSQPIVAHLGLAFGAALPLFVVELPLTNLQKWLIILSGYVILIPLFRWLHRTYATKFVKVFRCDYEMASRIVQRALNAKNLPFTKRQGDEQIVFQIRMHQMNLVIDAFMLNMPIDDHLIPEIATKLTLRPETSENAPHMARLRTMLDEAFAMQGL